MARARQQIGPMRHRILIGQRTESADAYGGAAVTFPTLATCWAAMDVTGQAGALGPGGQIFDETRLTFTIRADAAAVRQGDRITYDGRTFSVESVANADERKRFKQIEALEREFG